MGTLMLGVLIHIVPPSYLKYIKTLLIMIFSKNLIKSKIDTQRSVKIYCSKFISSVLQL